MVRPAGAWPMQGRLFMRGVGQCGHEALLLFRVFVSVQCLRFWADR